jgi:hypothetical protein
MDVDEIAGRAGVPAADVRAVIQALCDPSQAMIEAGMDAYLRASRFDGDLELEVWRAMIGALLSPADGDAAG